MTFSLCAPNHRVNNDSAPLIVLMDIDHTMIKRSVFDSQEAADEYVAKLPTLKTLMNVNKEPTDERVLFCQQRKSNGTIIHFNFRPGLFELLLALSKTCELHLYTAGNQVYAENVASLFGSDCFPKHRIWSNCGGWISFCGNGHWKEVSKLPLGRNGDLNRVVLIDDNMQTLLANPTNVYHVTEFFDDPSDDELYKALDFFNSKLIDSNDVRQGLWERNKIIVPKVMNFYSRDAFMSIEPFKTLKKIVMEQENKKQGLAPQRPITNTTNADKSERGAMATITTVTVNSPMGRVLSSWQNHSQQGKKRKRDADC